jgi:holliday junction DNA helicase RuvB
VADRIISAEERPEDDAYGRQLRPRRLADFIGQPTLRVQLSTYMEAARQRAEPLEHVLFYGPPGLGKTTLANIIADEMGAKIKITSGPAIERPPDLIGDLSRINRGDVLFIDEIHRLNPKVEEFLYPAMEDFVIDFGTGKGPSATSLRIPLKAFTLVGATTRMANISGPLRDRFGIVFKLDYYDEESLTQIVVRSAGILGVTLEDSAAREVARRSRGTPRVANRLLKRVRDYAQVRSAPVIDMALAQGVLEELGVDALGLDEVDRQVLHTLVVRFDGKPVGLHTIAAATGEDADTVEDVYEPYLIQLGFLHRSPRGRLATRRAYEHLGIPYPQRPPQAGLFD